ncbi:hypothetical protein LguiA_025900 [Lonicera macranthoides]
MWDYLPPEVMNEILTRLPVKTLLRCTRVQIMLLSAFYWIWLASCTSSWRNANAGDFSYFIEEHAPLAILNGTVHCVGYNPNRVGGTFRRLIVSFDMGSETFGAAMVPSSLQNEWRLRVSTFGESLSGVYHRDNSCCIWVLKVEGVQCSRLLEKAVHYWSKKTWFLDTSLL